MRALARIHRLRGPIRYPGGASVFNPATLALSGWWKADYSGMPWAGNASAGASGGRSLVTVVGAPTTGTAVNGKTPASFDGVNDLVGISTTMADYVTVSAGTIYMVVKPITAAADGGIAANPGFIGDGGGGAMTIGYSANGAEAFIFDGASKSVEVACASGAYHLIEVAWNGTNLYCAVDSGARSSVACGNIVSALGGDMLIGRNVVSAAYQDFHCLEIATSTSCLTDTDRANFKSYVNSRYGLSL